jgi:DNA-binding beta-propeller fold protein YncE
MLRRSWILVVSLGLTVATAVVSCPSARAATLETSAFIPVSPTRLLDTRDRQPLTPGSTVRLQIAGVAGVPRSAVAVSLNVTVNEARAAGFVTVWPTGLSQPTASNLNVERAGQTIANAVVVPVGTDGSVTLFDQPGGQLIVDINGAWTPASSSAGGRFVPTAPTRVLDSRSTQPLTTLRVPLGDNARHASAAAVNLTVTNPRRGGFVSVWPAGTPQPQVSSLNVEHPDQTIANFAIVPLGLDGSIDIWTNTQADVIIDLLGTFTKADAPISSDGLFVALTPSRLFDTRDDPDGPLRGGWRRDIAITARADIPADNVSAVLANLTATETSQATWLSAYPSGTSLPTTSTLNLERTYQTLPNMMLSRVGANGAISLYAQRTTHAIVDALGYFTGPSAPPNADVSLIPPTPAFPSSDGPLHLVHEVSGTISPKSVVSNGTGLVFAQNMMYNHSVTVYDRDGDLVRTISDQVGAQQGAPVEAAAFPGGRQMYISNYSMYGPGAGPEGFDACTATSAISDSTVYRLTGLAIDQVIPVGKVPKYVAVSPDKRWLVVSNWCGEDVSIVDIATAREVRRVHVGRNPRGLAITSDSAFAYVALMGEGRVTKINLASGAVSPSVPIGGGARHLNLSPDGRWLYVTLNEEGSVAKVDTTTMHIVGRATTGTQPRSATLTADGRYLYVVNYESSSASKVRTSDMTVVQTVETAANPIGITYDDEVHQLWVSCYVGRILIFHD